MRNKKHVGVLVGLLLSVHASTSYAVTLFTDLASFDAATNTVLVEDFTGWPTYPNTFSSFTSNGNTYTALAGVSPSPNITVVAGQITAGLGGSTILTANGQEEFTIDFGNPGTALGFDAYFNGLGPLTLELFSASGSLGVFTPNPSVSVGFLGFVSSAPITKLHWTATLGGQVNTGIDNIRQGTAPEPTTLALLGLGLAAFGFRSKKKLN